MSTWNDLGAAGARSGSPVAAGDPGYDPSAASRGRESGRGLGAAASGSSATRSAAGTRSDARPESAASALADPAALACLHSLEARGAFAGLRGRLAYWLIRAALAAASRLDE
jgi:hypothetical protein